MSWHFVNAAGDAQGPVSLEELKSKYESRHINDDSYVWNGADVSQWTPLNQVSSLFNQVKAASQPKAPSGGGAPRRNPLGGRANLLAGIQAGGNLKKVAESEKKDVSVSVSVPPPSSEGESPAPKAVVGGGAGKMTMQEQMAQVLKNRAGGGTKTTGARPGGVPAPTNPSTTSTVKAPTTTAKTTTPATTSSTTPSWKQKSQTGSSTTVPTIKKVIESEEQSGGDDRIERIKSLLANAEPWQLQAIEKILS